MYSYNFISANIVLFKAFIDLVIGTFFSHDYSN